MTNSKRFNANSLSLILITSLSLTPIYCSTSKESAYSSIFDDDYTNENYEQLDYSYDATSFNENNLRGYENRIVGGIEAKPGQFPYQALVIYPSSLCGGVIMNERHILTAAHCVINRKNGSLLEISNFLVSVGDFDISAQNDGEQKFRVEKIFIHPNISARGINNDLSILRLNGIIQFGKTQGGNGFTESACPPLDPELRMGEKLTLSGWGRTGPTKQEEFAQRLRSLDVPFISEQFCKSYYPSLPLGTICVGHLDGVRNACYGDSGGPVIRRRSSGCPEVHGILSFIVRKDNSTQACVPPGIAIASSFEYHKNWIIGTILKSSLESRDMV